MLFDSNTEWLKSDSSAKLIYKFNIVPVIFARVVVNLYKGPAG